MKSFGIFIDENLRWQTHIDKLSKKIADANRLIRQLDWNDWSTQFQIQKALMVYNSLNGLVPEYLFSKFVKRNETRYSLRDSVNKLS